MYKKLKEIVDIKQGYSSRDGLPVDNSGNVGLILPSNIGDTGWVDYPYVQKVSLDDAGKHLLSLGEVLFVARGRYAAAIHERNDMSYIASPMLFRLTVTVDSILPAYLALYLNSLIAKREMTKLTSSGTMPAITKAQLEELPISVIPIQDQNTVVELYEEYGKWVALQKKQSELKSQLIGNVIKNIIQGESNV